MNSIITVGKRSTKILKLKNDYTECTPVTTNTNTDNNAGQMSSAARQC